MRLQMLANRIRGAPHCILEKKIRFFWAKNNLIFEKKCSVKNDLMFEGVHEEPNHINNIFYI